MGRMSSAHEVAVRNFCQSCVQQSGRAVLSAEQAVSDCSRSGCHLHGVRPRVTGRVPADLALVGNARERQRLATAEAQRLGFGSLVRSYTEPA